MTDQTKQPKRTSGVILTFEDRAPRLARIMCEALEAAGMDAEPILNWHADPKARTVTIKLPGSVK